MEIKINNKKTMMELIAIAVLLFWAVNHPDMVRAGFRYVTGILSPVVIGCVVAFVLNVPMGAWERVLKKHTSLSGAALRGISIALSLLSLLLLLVFVFAAIIPELVNTVRALNSGVPELMEHVNVWLSGILEEYPEMQAYLTQLELNWQGIVESAVKFLKNGVSNVIVSTWGMAASVIGVVSSAAIGFMLSLYMLLRKETLCRQMKKMVYAYLPQKAVPTVMKVAGLANRTFSSFISGQCMEAVAFGVLTYAAMLIFRFPYARSISVLIGFATLIPVAGAFVGTALGAVLILVESPIKAIWFLILIGVLQQIDGNLIYPRIVGNSVGLPGMWVLIAVTVGGSLMGVTGMLIFVPLFSVFYQLLREDVNRQLEKKQIPPF